MTRIGLTSTEQPASPLVLALAPVLAATGLEVSAAIDDFLAFDIDRRKSDRLMLMRGHGPNAAERLPAERVFWIGEPPFTRSAPAGRTLGKARFHEVCGLVTGRARGGPLHKAVLETGAYILTGLRMMDRTGSVHAINGALNSGTAAERLAAMFGADALEDPARVAPLAPVRRDVIAPARGAITSWAGGPLRAALDALGRGGAIGRLAEPGYTTGPKKPVARIYAEDERAADAGEKLLAEAIRLG
ncbi:MAG: hypothetical protein VYB54_07940 [Pseudomonadota bacterium]|nr:hypothetical protein [Pseudomonadota bacterium]